MSFVVNFRGECTVHCGDALKLIGKSIASLLNLFTLILCAKYITVRGTLLFPRFLLQ